MSQANRKRTWQWLRCAAVLAVLSSVAWLLPWVVDLPESLDSPAPASPVIVDRHGEPVARLVLPDARRADPVLWSELPADLVACTLAAEDKRFWRHSGVDVLAMARAASDNLRSGEVVSGASTITQQLVKISSPPVARTLPRKLHEALCAIQLERRWGKEEILTAALNRFDYGNRSLGVGEAARFYFQKPLGDLSLAECALLAGLPQGPTRLNPLRWPRQALERRNTVLERAVAAGLVPQERGRQAMAEPMVLRPVKPRTIAPWLVGISPPDGARGKIRSTLDAALQRDVEDIVRAEVGRLREANLRHAAVVVLENQSAEVWALVSSADWQDPRGGQINGAFAARSPGSALKPFTYLLALTRGGRGPTSILADVPSLFRTPQGVDLPQNYDRAFRGPVMLRDALACSLNVPAMRELNRLGGPRPLHDLLERWGVEMPGADPHGWGLGLTIGNAPVRLIDLTGAYATLAREGRHRKPRLFPTTNAVDDAPQGITREACLMIAEILADPVARAPSFPPGGPLDLPFSCAVKTGTTSDFRDNWCIGFTRDYTVGVWAGNFENQPMKEVSGVDGAAPIFHRVMRRLHRDRRPGWWDEILQWPEAVVDPRTGLSRTAGAGPLRQVRLPSSQLPQAAAAADYDALGRACLDGTFAGWYLGEHNRRRAELALRDHTEDRAPLRILHPQDGEEFLLDPEMPGSGMLLHPVSEPAGPVRWESDTLRVESTNGRTVVRLVPGRHGLRAVDLRDGSVRQLNIRVRTF